MATELKKGTYLLTQDLLADPSHKDALVKLAQAAKPGKAARGGLLTREQRNWVHVHISKVAWPLLSLERQRLYDHDGKAGRKEPKRVETRMPWQVPEAATRGSSVARVPAEAGTPEPARSSSWQPSGRASAAEATPLPRSPCSSQPSASVAAAASASAGCRTRGGEEGQTPPAPRRLDFDSCADKAESSAPEQDSKKRKGGSWSSFTARRRRQLKASVADLVRGSAKDAEDAAAMLGSVAKALEADFPGLEQKLVGALRSADCRCQPLVTASWPQPRYDVCFSCCLERKSALPQL